ncbi:MAG: hypothetical protein M3295_05070, partial [Chloroflexota bacterium]|nr:hypothetical protein [Chloroflexota bacterium]
WIGGGDLPRDDRACRLDLPIAEELTPLAYVLPGYLLAERVAAARGIDADAPAGLQKVTRTT